MIEQWRNTSKQWISKAILGLVLASFILWGMGDLILQSKKDHVVDVGKHFVTASEFAQQLKTTIVNFEQQHDQKMLPEMIDESGISYTVLNRLLHRELLNEEGSRLKIVTPDEIMRAEISKISAFQNPDGSFSREKFRSVLINQGMTEQQFVKTFQQESNRQQLLTVLQHLSESVDFPDFMVRKYYQWMYAPRLVKIIQYKDQEMIIDRQPSEEVLQDFYNRESRHFIEPEARDITVLWLDPKKRAAHIIISDDMIHQYYKENLQSFMTPESRKVQWNDFESLEEAEKFVANKNLKNKGTVQNINPQMFPTEIAQILFSLPINEFSQPLQTRNAYRVYKILAVEPAKTLSLSTVKETIKEKLQLEKNQEALHEDIKYIDDALGSGAIVEDIVKNYSLESKNIEKITEVDQLLDKIPLSFAKEIALQLFTLNQGDISPFISVSTGEYIAIIVNKITPKKQPALQDIKEKISLAWGKKERQKQADKQANAVINSINTGLTLEEAAQKNQAKIQTLEIDFMKPSEKIEKEILKILVSLTPGKSAVVRSKDASFVLYLDQIKQVSVEKTQLKDLQRHLKEIWLEDLLNGYLENIRRHVSVVIHKPLVQAVIDAVKSN